MGRSAKDLVDVGQRFVEEADDGPLLPVAKARTGRQHVDVEPIGLVGRRAAGRGVRLSQVAELFQRSQLIPDGGGADPKAGTLGQGLAPHGLPGPDVVPDQSPKDGHLAFGKLALSRHAGRLLLALPP